jgi:organic radical activating enzyme
MINSLYKPTKNDQKRLLPKPGYFKVSGDKVFATLQGEGLFEKEGGTAGCPAVFFRLQFCNLQCGLRKGWKCDTGYTWDKRREEYWKEPGDWTIEKSKNEIEKAWKKKFSGIDVRKKRLVITGGEPLLQQDRIIKLINIMPGWQFEIETNGTIIPDNNLKICQINCSPKLENSGNKKELRYRPEVLRVINSWPQSWFKFVVNEISDFTEIKEIAVNCGLSQEKILIMPEGFTLETVNDNKKKVEKKLIASGWKISDRNQLLWYGSKRRT